MPTNFFSSPYTSVPQAVLAEELNQLEKRARAINLSLAPLAARAGVRVSQISQWKAGSPVTGTTAGSISAPCGERSRKRSTSCGNI